MSSLRRALLVWILGGLVVVLLAAGGAVYLVARARFRAQHDESLVARAGTFASLAVVEAPDPLDLDDDGGLAFDYHGPLSELDLGVLFRVTDEEGQVLAQSPDWPPDLAPPDEVPDPEEAPSLAHIDLPSGEPARIVSFTSRARFEPPDADDLALLPLSEEVVYVEVIGRLEPAQRAESALLAALLAGGALAALGAAATVTLGVRRALRPVRRLRAALACLDPRALSPLGDAPTYPEELRPMVLALDDLLSRAREALDRESRFTDAAAHELRTPIAELRTLAEVAERWPEPDRLRRLPAEAGAIAGELGGLLESLLAITRSADAMDQAAMEPVPLLPLARSICGASTADGAARMVAWEFSGDDSACWTGPRAAVNAILRNLIANAAEYTPDGGSVRITARATGSSAAAFVVENGPVSLRPEESGLIFEPFWRADPSRTDRRRRGMGLAIVSSLCHVLGLTVSAEVTQDGRLRVAIDGSTAGAR